MVAACIWSLANLSISVKVLEIFVTIIAAFWNYIKKQKQFCNKNKKKLGERTIEKFFLCNHSFIKAAFKICKYLAYTKQDIIFFKLSLVF